MEIKQTTKETLQGFILQGKKIILKKENQTQFIQIRFNLNDIDGTTKWRVIVDGIEYQTSEVQITIPCNTESEFYEDLGGYKHHIVAQANKVEFYNNIAIIS
jgi:hypothetical protein